MNQYRLFIDLPLGDNEEKAISATHAIMSHFMKDDDFFVNLTPTIEKINYRLGYDEDRQRSNYLLKNENGHVANKKITRVIGGQSIEKNV